MRSSLLLLFPLLISGCVTVDATNSDTPQASDKQRSEARIALGMGYLEQGNMIKARENLEKALDHDPNFYRAQLSMAHYFEQVGENDSAEKLYKTALRQHPRNGNVLNNYGTFLCKQEEYALADKYFNKAIDQPYYYLISASYENAAFCALKAGNNEQAMQYFNRSLAHQPNRPSSMLNLAKLEIDSGAYTEARLRLMQFHKRYGLRKPSLRLMVDLEQKAGNKALENKYRSELEKLEQSTG